MTLTGTEVPKRLVYASLRCLDVSDDREAEREQIYAETRQELAPDAAPQEVLVLRDGFSGFQSRYRVSQPAPVLPAPSQAASASLTGDVQNDPELVEKFNKYYHD